MTQEVIFEELAGKEGNIGLITLNRQQALNALNHSMFIAMYQQVQAWQSADTIKAVIVKAAPGRAFCAGGDIRSVYERKKANDLDLPNFFPKEYAFDQLIFHYPKPYIALLDGITMGGGAGISLHGSHRVATEQFVFAMPETTIGFYPDVGASYFLSRLPHYIGFYLGLTGETITCQDSYALKLVDVVIERHSQEALINALVETALPNDLAVTNLINQWRIPVARSTLLDYQDEIAACFSKPSVEEILSALENHTNAWCHKTADILKKKSPTSLHVTLRALQKGKTLSFDACMQMENKITQQMIQGHDFFEGIRALLIDKDQTPHWEPPTLAAVRPEDVARYFDA